jgi:hypothetical protein
MNILDLVLTMILPVKRYMWHVDFSEYAKYWIEVFPLWNPQITVCCVERCVIR